MTFSFQVADIASRFYALLTDTIIQGVLLMGALMITGLIGVGISQFRAPIDNLMYALIAIELFLIQFGYFVVLEWRMQGQTPGKAIFGLRVMKLDGTPFTLGDSMIRNLVRVFEFLPLGYALGAAIMLFSPQARRLGDYAARTVVVRTRNSVSAWDLRRMAQVPASPGDSISNAASFRLSAHDIQRIEAFFVRMPGMINQQRMARMLADDARSKLGDAAGDYSGAGDFSGAGGAALKPSALPGLSKPDPVNPDVVYLRIVVAAWHAKSS